MKKTNLYKVIYNTYVGNNYAGGYEDVTEYVETLEEALSYTDVQSIDILTVKKSKVMTADEIKKARIRIAHKYQAEIIEDEIIKTTEHLKKLLKEKEAVNA